MNMKFNLKRGDRLFILYILIYSAISLMTLLRFPLIHSDEVWLAGMTRDYMNSGNVFMTESFFDLMPRTAHTLSISYHLWQMPFIQLFGYQVFSVRLLSLFASIGTLVIIYAIQLTEHIKPEKALLVTILLSTNIQFVYASHFARQEMLLAFILCLAIFTYLNNRFYATAIILGLSIGIHPNIFIVTTMIGALLLYDLLQKKITYKAVLLFMLIIAVFAFAHIAVTLVTNQAFFTQYSSYGSTLNVDAPILDRLHNLYTFYLKLYHQISGTYYIPPVKVILATTAVLIAGTAGALISGKVNDTKITVYFLMILGFNLAIFIIGRYNTTSIIFLLIPFYLYLSRIAFNTRYAATVLLCGLLFLQLWTLNIEYTKTKDHDYEQYETTIKNHLHENAVILGNLSSGFAMDSLNFYDIRNLAYLDINNMSVKSYIDERLIDTIIYYEEYDYIHRNPKWTILYGDDAYYDELNEFIKNKATLVHTFESTYYGSRIIRYMGDYPWKIYIYKVNPD